MTMDACPEIPSDWEDEDSIRVWKKNLDHQAAQRIGRETFYQNFTVRVARVDRDYTFDKNA
ncbi:MAG: hypothetical protein E2O35_02445 [Proteobacteria bacterium]|nr:MAG: hypothetical protein E2O35_02445 [Pseudomonadota bacterium]